MAICRSRTSIVAFAVAATLVLLSTIIAQPAISEENQPPTITVPAHFYVPWKITWMFYVNASDGDGDVLRFTWFWGDGTMTVTPTRNAAHTYLQKGTFTLTVFAADQTGLPGHNVSDSNAVVVCPCIPGAPPILSFTATSTVAEVGEKIFFTGVTNVAVYGVLKMTFQYAGNPSTYDVVSSGTLYNGEQFAVTVNHSYSTAGTKSVFLYVEDEYGRNVTTQPITLTIAPPSIEWHLNLAAGWNLVSLPLLASYTADTLPGLERGDVVANWNSASQAFDKIFIKGVSPPITDFSITTSAGYCVYVSTAKNLTLRGFAPTAQQSKSITVPTSGGWALIGLCSLRTDWHASDFGPIYWGHPLTMVAVLSDGAYMVHIIGLPMNNFSINPGQGCWVFVTGSGTLTYNP